MSDNNFLVEMGIRISKRRKELNLTQEQVAEKINLSLQSVSCIELGKKAIRPENLYNLCKALDISVDYILTGKKTVEQLGVLCEKIAQLDDNDYAIIEKLLYRFES